MFNCANLPYFCTDNCDNQLLLILRRHSNPRLLSPLFQATDGSDKVIPDWLTERFSPSSRLLPPPPRSIRSPYVRYVLPSSSRKPPLPSPTPLSNNSVYFQVPPHAIGPLEKEEERSGRVKESASGKIETPNGKFKQLSQGASKPLVGGRLTHMVAH